MASVAPNYINGTIGGVETPIFVGTPGLPGAQASNGSGGFFDFINPKVQDQADFFGMPLDDATKAAAGAVNAGKKSTSGGTDWTSLFLRAVVIILGFIFVAVGLTMFHSAAPVIVEQAGRGARSIGRKVIGKK